MVYVVTRLKRHTGYYKDTFGRARSAGTFSTKAKALNSALLAEEGIVSDNPVFRTTLEAYLKDWLSKTDVRISTRKTYAVALKKYVVPSLGHRQVTTITKRDVRSLFEKLLKEGVSPSTVAHVKIALGSSFRPLVEDEKIPSNPTHGVKVKVPHADPFTYLEPNDFKKIVEHLPTEGTKLFAEFLVSSGCRFGEATELRVKDINFQSKEVSVRRTVSDVGSQHNNGSRYLVLPTTKTGHKRTIVLSQRLLTSLSKYVKKRKLLPNDLLFSRNNLFDGVKIINAGSQTERTTYTIGSQCFQHATPRSYNVGKCRCNLCKEAVNKYRKQYRKDKSKGRGVSKSNFSGHLSRERWRATWHEAIEKSGIGWYPRTHDLRHANATQLLSLGVNVHEVKERLGHQSITTTERYLHRIRHQQSKAGELVDEYLLGER